MRWKILRKKDVKEIPGPMWKGDVAKSRVFPLTKQSSASKTHLVRAWVMLRAITGLLERL